MVKTRFNLSETMEDARQGIEEAKASAARVGEENTPKTGTLPVEPEQPAPEVTVQPEPAFVPEEETGESGPKAAGSEANAKMVRLRKKVRKMDSGERNLRNVYLDDESLEMFEDIKKRMNRTRNKEKKDVFVSVIDLLNIAAQEFLDRYYEDIVGK